ncbi:MAG: prepilin-type N-terminal cleavage/methylation domain-containing protein [Phycisphaerales bacterium]|nr:MAG: prepilin-type N-terminal cleavage/methylation domain-containing protein [Phycisphaerales bacterium]
MRVLRRDKGFSFVEILISIILVGLSITALLSASTSFTMANGAGADLSTAEFLVEQIRELTALLPVMDPAITFDQWTSLTAGGDEPTVYDYDDVDDFNGFDSTSLGAPIDANRNPVTALSAFSQSVVVQKVSQGDFNLVKAASSTDTAFIRVTVTVSLNGREITSASWIRANY